MQRRKRNFKNVSIQTCAATFIFFSATAKPPTQLLRAGRRSRCANTKAVLRPTPGLKPMDLPINLSEEPGVLRGHGLSHLLPGLPFADLDVPQVLPWLCSTARGCFTLFAAIRLEAILRSSRYSSPTPRCRGILQARERSHITDESAGHSIPLPLPFSFSFPQLFLSCTSPPETFFQLISVTRPIRMAKCSLPAISSIAP